MSALDKDKAHVRRIIKRRKGGAAPEILQKLQRIEKAIDILSQSQNPKKQVENHPVILGKILYDAFLYKKGDGLPVHEALDTLKEDLNNRSSFYVLKLPHTCSETDKEDLGIKIGKSEGQSIIRLRDYYLRYGKHVKVLHIRIFPERSRRSTETRAESDTKFTATKRYELVIKRLMGKVPGTRARTVSTIPEYFNSGSLPQLMKAMKSADGNAHLVKSALPLAKSRLKNRKYHGTFVPAPANPEKTGCSKLYRCLFTGVRVLVYSENQTFVQESGGNVARGVLEGEVRKQGNSVTFNVLWDLDDITIESIQRSHVTFSIKKYAEAKEGGWILEKSHLARQHPWNLALKTNPMDILGDGHVFSKEVYDYFKTRRELSMEQA